MRCDRLCTLDSEPFQFVKLRDGPAAATAPWRVTLDSVAKPERYKCRGYGGRGFIAGHGAGTVSAHAISYGIRSCLRLQQLYKHCLEAALV
jgi:hypothetical protein